MGVHVVKLPSGDHLLGAEIDGVFVAFASHSAARVAQMVERGKNLAERAENGDELARDQIGKPIGEAEPRSKSVGKMTSDELDQHAHAHSIDDFPFGGTVDEKRAAIREFEAAGEDA